MRRAAESLYDSQSKTGETITHANQVQRAYGAYRQGTFISRFKSFISIFVAFARAKWKSNLFVIDWQANTWCTRGIELLASQNSTTPPDQALQELQQLIEAAEEFHHPRCIFEDSVMPETKALITQVYIFLKIFHECES